MIKLIVCYNPCTYMSTGIANCLFLLKPHMHAGMNCYNLQDSTDQYNFVSIHREQTSYNQYEKEKNSRGSEQEYLTKYKNSYVASIYI